MYLSPKSQSPLFLIKIDGERSYILYLYIYNHIDGTCLSSILGFEPSQRRPNLPPFKTAGSFGFQLYINTIYKWMKRLYMRMLLLLSIAQPESFSRICYNTTQLLETPAMCNGLDPGPDAPRPEVGDLSSFCFFRLPGKGSRYPPPPPSLTAADRP